MEGGGCQEPPGPGQDSLLLAPHLHPVIFQMKTAHKRSTDSKKNYELRCREEIQVQEGQEVHHAQEVH